MNLSSPAPAREGALRSDGRYPGRGGNQIVPHCRASGRFTRMERASQRQYTISDQGPADETGDLRCIRNVDGLLELSTLAF
jgi:hypothetical protein